MGNWLGLSTSQLKKQVGSYMLLFFLLEVDSLHLRGGNTRNLMEDADGTG